MNDKDLNKLDGSSMLQEVMAEKVERNRKLYKTAIKNAVVRNDNAQASAKKQVARADKTQTVLNDLVDGGMEGYLAKTEDTDEDDDDSGGVSPAKKKLGYPYKRSTINRYSRSSMSTSTGSW